MRAAARRVRLAAVLLLAAGLCRADRVVAIGDLHGAYDEFVGILLQTGLIDKDLNWTGGKRSEERRVGKECRL